MNSIIYAAKGPRIEAIAGVLLGPGQWVRYGPNKGEVILDTQTDGCAKLIVIEDSSNGVGVDGSYDVGSTVQLLSPINGDVVYSRATGSLATIGTQVEIGSFGAVDPAEISEILRFRIMGVTLEASQASVPYWVKIQVAGK